MYNITVIEILAAPAEFLGNTEVEDEKLANDNEDFLMSAKITYHFQVVVIKLFWEVFFLSFSNWTVHQGKGVHLYLHHT